MIGVSTMKDLTKIWLYSMHHCAKKRTLYLEKYFFIFQRKFRLRKICFSKFFTFSSYKLKTVFCVLVSDTTNVNGNSFKLESGNWEWLNSSKFDKITLLSCSRGKMIILLCFISFIYFMRYIHTNKNMCYND